MIALVALFQVVLIDLVLAGDNALVIGALAAKLDSSLRRHAIMIGILAAIVARLVFTISASWLLMIPAIGAIGGTLLIWIAWKLFQDTRDDGALNASGETKRAPAAFLPAVWAILAADVSMSLDNILGVAGVARGHFIPLTIGLILSMVLMGTAANWIAAQMQRWPWLIYIGIAAITIAGGRMIVGAFL